MKKGLIMIIVFVISAAVFGQEAKLIKEWKVKLDHKQLDIYLFHKGHQVHYLIAPDGHLYITGTCRLEGFIAKCTIEGKLIKKIPLPKSKNFDPFFYGFTVDKKGEIYICTNSDDGPSFIVKMTQDSKILWKTPLPRDERTYHDPRVMIDGNITVTWYEDERIKSPGKNRAIKIDPNGKLLGEIPTPFYDANGVHFGKIKDKGEICVIKNKKIEVLKHKLIDKARRIKPAIIKGEVYFILLVEEDIGSPYKVSVLKYAPDKKDKLEDTKISFTAEASIDLPLKISSDGIFYEIEIDYKNKTIEMHFWKFNWEKDKKEKKEKPKPKK